MKFSLKLRPIMQTAVRAEYRKIHVIANVIFRIIKFTLPYTSFIE